MDPFAPKVHEVCTEALGGRHGIVGATFSSWKPKFAGIEVLEATRVQVLGDESRRLKKLLTEAPADNAALNDVVRINF